MKFKNFRVNKYLLIFFLLSATLFGLSEWAFRYRAQQTPYLGWIQPKSNNDDMILALKWKPSDDGKLRLAVVFEWNTINHLTSGLAAQWFGKWAGKYELLGEGEVILDRMEDSIYLETEGLWKNVGYIVNKSSTSLDIYSIDRMQIDTLSQTVMIEQTNPMIYQFKYFTKPKYSFNDR